MLGKGAKGGKGKEEGEDDLLNNVGSHFFALCFQIQQGIGKYFNLPTF